MKKVRLFVFVLIISVMLMGAGYAYWTETLAINTTVQTGALELKFKNPSVDNLSPDVNYSGGTAVVNAGDDNILDVTLTDMYPGAKARVNFEIENNGTLKAIIKNFNISDFAQKDDILIHNFIVDGTNYIGNNNNGNNNGNPHNNPITLAEWENSLLQHQQGAGQFEFVIDKNETLPISMELEIDPDATESEVPERATIQFTMTADGLQYNDNTR